MMHALFNYLFTLRMDNEQSNQPTPVTPPTPTPVTSEAPKTDDGVSNETIMGILCYLGPLVIIPFLMAKDDAFVKFHMKQGLVLVAIWFITYIVQETILPWRYFEIVGFINLGITILSIIGIVYVVQKKETKIPLIGNLADNIKI
jgi:uncharacterized membrane protein